MPNASGVVAHAAVRYRPARPGVRVIVYETDFPPVIRAHHSCSRWANLALPDKTPCRSFRLESSGNHDRPTPAYKTVS